MQVSATSRGDYSREAGALGVSFFQACPWQLDLLQGLRSLNQKLQDSNDLCEEHPDVVILASSILSLEEVLTKLPVARLKRSTLFVDVCSVKEFPKRLMLSVLPPEVLLRHCKHSAAQLCLTAALLTTLCTSRWTSCARTRCLAQTAARAPGRGSTSCTSLCVWGRAPHASSAWTASSRCVPAANASRYWQCRAVVELTRGDSCRLQFFSGQGCRMVEMTCEEHDRIAASTQFITHTGVLLYATALSAKPAPKS